MIDGVIPRGVEKNPSSFSRRASELIVDLHVQHGSIREH